MGDSRLFDEILVSIVGMFRLESPERQFISTAFGYLAETHRDYYSVSQRPEAPQGSTRPVFVTGRPIS